MHNMLKVVLTQLKNPFRFHIYGVSQPEFVVTITANKHVMQKYAKHVGLKRDFRLVVRGAARNMIKILNGSGKLLENLFIS